MTRLCARGLLAFWLMHGAAVYAEPSMDQTGDVAAVYRYDPFLEQLQAVPADQVKPGFLYQRYSPKLGTRIWSLATANGGFEYAMAPGSIQPARALDLRATPEKLREELVARAPELARVMDMRGGVAYVQLTEEGAWKLVPHQTIANVFDLETGRRWEWHGERRVAVVHTGGFEWSIGQGKFIPAVSYGLMPCGAWSY